MTLLKTSLLVAAALSLTACGKSETSTAGATGDRFAGLDTEIKTWREDIVANHVLCTGKTGDMACQQFGVACKAERTITPEETQKGVAAKIVAAMTFNGKGASATDIKPGSAFAEFARTGTTWTRTETGPVNLSSCATF
jgi:hypothetical protein